MVVKKKPRKLTIKQEKFINEVMISGNATESASKVYNVKNRVVAGAIGAENLQKPQIIAEIQDRVQIAKDNIFKLATNAKSENVKLSANQDIVDRKEGKATIKVGGDDGLPFIITVVNYGNKTDTDPA